MKPDLAQYIGRGTRQLGNMGERLRNLSAVRRLAPKTPEAPQSPEEMNFQALREIHDMFRVPAGAEKVRAHEVSGTEMAGHPDQALLRYVRFEYSRLPLKNKHITGYDVILATQYKIGRTVDLGPTQVYHVEIGAEHDTFTPDTVLHIAKQPTPAQYDRLLTTISIAARAIQNRAALAPQPGLTIVPPLAVAQDLFVPGSREGSPVPVAQKT